MQVTPVAPRVMLSPRLIARCVTVVLAGGPGEKLLPLTQDRSKPAVPFGGKYRIVDFVLSNCINSGFRHIFVMTQYKSQALTEHVQGGWSFLTREMGEFIVPVPPQVPREERWYEETAEAIVRNLSPIQFLEPPHVLILNAEHLYKMDYSRMMQAHLDTGADVTVCCIPCARGDASRFSVVETDGSGRVKNFVEGSRELPAMPSQPDKCLVNMEIYLFRAGALYAALGAEAKGSGSRDLSRDVLPSMLHRFDIQSYLFEDESRGGLPYWRDIENLSAYYDANMDLVSVSPACNLYDTHWPIYTFQPQLAPAKTVFADIGSRAGLVLDSVVCGGVIISGGEVYNSILGPRVRVNSYSQVSESILMDNVNVGRFARIRRAIIDKYVVIPPGTEIGYDLEADRARFHVTDDGIVVIPKNAILS